MPFIFESDSLYDDNDIQYIKLKYMCNILQPEYLDYGQNTSKFPV